MCKLCKIETNQEEAFQKLLDEMSYIGLLEYDYGYHYDHNGKLLETEAVPGFENIIGEEQPLDFLLVGDYMVFRTYESLTSYICKRTSNGTELIMKGADGNVSYAISTINSESQNSTYIFFIESNVKDDDTL